MTGLAEEFSTLRPGATLQSEHLRQGAVHGSGAPLGRES